MRYLLILPAQYCSQANATAKEHFDAVAGELTFTVPLFEAAASDDSSPSHFWASAEVDDDKAPLLAGMLPAFPGAIAEPYDLATDAGYPQRRLIALGLRTAHPALTQP